MYQGMKKRKTIAWRRVSARLLLLLLSPKKAASFTHTHIRETFDLLVIVD